MAFGPDPKHPSVRARRNKTSTARTLSAVPEDGKPREIPPLPDDQNGEWHPLTVEWWNDIWESPMAPEFDDSDIHGLYMLAALVDRFWHDPESKLAAEIRLQRQCFGLTPMDRRRLQWEIDRGDAAQESTRKRRNQRAAQGVPAEQGTADPRRQLEG